MQKLDMSERSKEIGKTNQSNYVRDLEKQKLRKTGFESLTAKEKIVCQLITQGYKNRDIGEVIGTSEHVIKNMTRVLYDKTGMGNRVELALWWMMRMQEQEKLNKDKGKENVLPSTSK